MSIAQTVRLYLRNKPYILEGLEQDIVNLSALSRKITKDLKMDRLRATKAAVIRFSKEYQKQTREMEMKVLKVLKGSRITLEDGMNVLVSEKPLPVEPKFFVGLEDSNVYIVDKLSDRVSESDLICKHENCGVFIIRSPSEIEQAPGVVAYLTSVLAEQNINVIEFTSCYTCTMLAIEKKDVARTYETLKPLVE